MDSYRRLIMKFREKIAAFSILLIALLAGCSLLGQQSSPQRPAPVRHSKVSTISLQSYFPQKIGTSWIVNGMAEYGHRMVLTSVRKDQRQKKTIHDIIGNVDDMSDGESKRNFHFRLRYTFTSNAVQEEVLEADTPFPHTFKKLTLLQQPIRKGARWQQTVTVKGKRAVLRGEILGIQRDPTQKTNVIRVRYRVPMAGMPNGTYEEIREYRQGDGIYRFEKTFGPNESDIFNYALWKVIPPAEFSDANYRVAFLYPSDWKKENKNHFQGYGGFFQVSAIHGPKSIDEAARSEAGHSLRPYGTNPTIQRLSIKGHAGRLILPSSDQAREMKKQAALIVRYSKQIRIAEQNYEYLVIYADADHIRLILNTLKFN